jgi:exodeoxyribonuclease VIII
MDIKQYHADTTRVSKSKLDELAKSPYHYWYKYLNPDRVKEEETDAFVIGRAIHTAILEPAKFNEEFWRAPVVNRRTKEGKNTIAEFQELNGNKTALKPDEWDYVMAMRDAAHKHPAIQHLLSGGIAEHTMYFNEPTTGVRCQIRPDWLNNAGYVVDLKSTEDASPIAFQRSVAKYRYHVQDAFYFDGIKHATGKEPKGFVFVVIEKKPPFMIGVYQLTERAREQGRQTYLTELNIYKTCQANGVWPGYSQTVEMLDLPPWAYPAKESSEQI